MGQSCDYCRGPVVGRGVRGRPWPGQPAAAYCCYGCLSLGEHERQEAHSALAQRPFRFDGPIVRLGIGLLVAGQSMIFGLAINLEESTPPSVRFAVQGVILAATLLVVALLGGPLFANASREVRRGRLTIEALFLLTMAGAMLASLQSFVTGRGPIYFEVVSVLLVVYTLGKLVGARTRAAALASTRLWAASLASCRVVDAQGRERTVPVAEVLPGDVVEVRPGEAVAVDGVIRSGVGFVSEAAVSGEPFAVVRRPGHRVLAGTASHDATFRIEATAPGTARQIDRLLEAVEEARSRPTSLQAQADRLGRIFFPLVVGVSVATFAFWSWRSGWEAGLFNAMSVLLVACPCALGLATPVVVWSALSRLAERGLVARAGDTVERLASVDRVVFDKTGTLTEEQFALVEIATRSTDEDRERVLGWLSLVEEQSAHPIAKPFAHLPRPFSSGAMPKVLGLRVVPGSGVEAELEADGVTHRLRVGRPEWIGAAGSAEEAELLKQLHAVGGHRVDLKIDGKLEAVAIVAERLRDSVPEALAALCALGLSVEVLTGACAERAAALNLPETRAGLLPDDKRERMATLRAAGAKPLMVGDGINDASALAAAHVGVALASGTDLANGAAALTLYHGDLRVLPWAVELSREAVRAVRRNLLRAAGYNVVGMTLAAFGVLHPVAAALLMVASSLLVAWSSVRIGTASEGCGCEEELLPPAPSPKRGGGVQDSEVSGERERCGAFRGSPSPPVPLSLLGRGGVQDLEVSGTNKGTPVVANLEHPLSPPWERGTGGEGDSRPSPEPSNLEHPPPRFGEGGRGGEVLHALALALQGVVAVLLLNLSGASALLTLLAFAAVGICLARCWRRRPDLSHALDMSFGMLTLGNLGMLLGWWADNGFAALHDGGCCACVEAMREGTLRPWMWLGMLLFANTAMAFLARRPHRGIRHKAAMFTGGNLGMVLGMVGGGWLAAGFEMDSVRLAAVLSFLGMTAGMVGGMLAGAELTRRLIGPLLRLWALPRWLLRYGSEG